MLKVIYTDKHWQGRTATWIASQQQLDWLLLKMQMGMYSYMTILSIDAE